MGRTYKHNPVSLDEATKIKKDVRHKIAHLTDNQIFQKWK